MHLTHHIIARQGEGKHQDGLVSIRHTRTLYTKTEIHGLIDQLQSIARRMQPKTIAELIPTVTPFN